MRELRQELGTVVQGPQESHRQNTAEPIRKPVLNERHPTFVPDFHPVLCRKEDWTCWSCQGPCKHQSTATITITTTNLKASPTVQAAKKLQATVAHTAIVRCRHDEISHKHTITRQVADPMIRPDVKVPAFFLSSKHLQLRHVSTLLSCPKLHVTP